MGRERCLDPLLEDVRRLVSLSFLSVFLLLKEQETCAEHQG